jgi:hypothetical protein
MLLLVCKNGVCFSWGVFSRCCCSCFKLQIASVPARDLQLISSFGLLNEFIFGFLKKINSELLQKIVFYLLICLFFWFGFLGGRFVCIFVSSLPGGIVSALRAWGAGSIFSGSERVCSGCEGELRSGEGVVSWFFFFFVLLER